mgnify:FL=1
MENSRSKKAVAASLSLALALGSVPAVALADTNADQGNASKGTGTESNYSQVTVTIQDETGAVVDTASKWIVADGSQELFGQVKDLAPEGYTPVSATGDNGSTWSATEGYVTLQVKKNQQQANEDVTFYAYIGSDTVTVEAKKNDTYVDALAAYKDQAQKAAPEGMEFIGWAYNGGTDKIAATDTVYEGVYVKALYAQKQVTEEGVNVTIEFVDEQGNTLGATDGFTATYRNQTIKADGKTDLKDLIQVPEGYDVNFAQNKGSESYVSAADGDTLLAQVKKQAAKHTLTVDQNGASATVEVEDGTSFYDALKPYEQSAKTNAPEGKVFAGWGWYNGTELVKIPLTEEVKGDAAVYAMYKDAVVERTVTVNSGTQTLGTTTVKDGDSLQGALAGFEQQAKDNAPSGKEFTGWATLVNGKFVPVVATTTVSSDVQVYAQYEDKYFTVDVFGGEGYGEEIDAANVKKDKNLTEVLSAYTDQAKALAPEGQKFIGWAWSNGESIDPNTTVTGDISVYAQYAAVESYTLSIGGMSDDPYAIQETAEVPEGTNLLEALSAYEDEAEAAAPEGKEFAGWTWADGSAVAGDATMAADVTVYASYQDVESYDVHVIYGSDTINPAETISVKKGTNLLEALEQCNEAAVAAAPEGKMLGWWQWSEDVDIDVDDTVMGEVTVQAKYVDAEYTVSVSVGYGDGQVEDAQLTAGYDANLLDTIGEDETLLEDAITNAPEGMRFAGWGMYGDEGLVAIDENTTVRSDLAVYAMYEEVASYDVNIYYGEDESTPKATPAFEKDSNLLENLDAYTELAKANAPEGKQFKAWGWTDSEGTVEIPADATVTGEGINVYAMYEDAVTPAEKITVNFVDNFNKTQNSVEINKGEAVAKPADPSYDGWEFEGWSSTLKDEQGNWAYTPVDFSKAVEDTDGDGVVTYYAFYNEAKADDNGNAATDKAATDESDAQGSDQQAADESSEAPQTGDATNAAAVAGIGGIAGLMAAAAALLRRRRNN